MSTAKRSRQQRTEARSASPLPASKRIKTANTSDVRTKSGLSFLVDEDTRAGRKLEARLTNGAPVTKASRVDESHAVVAPATTDELHNGVEDVNGKPQDVIDISSGEEESSEYESSDSEEGGDARDAEVDRLKVNGHPLEQEEGEGGDSKVGAEDEDEGAHDVDNELADREGGGDEEEGAEMEEPSFGDMLQARHPETIDVRSAFPDPMAERAAIIPSSGSRQLTAPSATSLGTVLTQALKTNDKAMLESCFEVTDLPSVRATIQRLHSQHVTSLLQRIAERVHRRPGRTGNLMVWIQWALVAHGGYLATQPQVMRKLRSLAQVLRERANGLQPLLHLKGKLDMLHAQLDLRRSMNAASRDAHANEEDDEEGVLYIEGQSDDWSDSEDAADEERVNRKLLEPPLPKRKVQTATPRFDESGSENGEDSDDDLRDDVPHASANDSDDGDEEAMEKDDDKGMFDIEAEEASEDDEDDSGEEVDSDPESDEESESSGIESEDTDVKGPKPAMLNRKR